MTRLAAPTLTIPITAGSAAYNVHLGHGLLRSVGESLAQLTAPLPAQLPAQPNTSATPSGKQQAVIITSSEVFEPWGESLLSGFAHAPLILTIPSGEAHKRLSTLERLAEQLAEAGADRDTVLIAFGGGVIGDMTGFLAAAYMRGIPYIGVPTTLLAQVDSSVGGKTGVNLAAGKNLFGAFHHPLAVFADTATLSTLPPAELRAGLQEAVKAGIIRDPILFEFMEREHAAILAGDRDALTEVVARSVRVKAEVVTADERESGLRMILNLGHTLGHAIEAATGYRQLLHGEAVAWGMLAAFRLALQRGFITAVEAHRMESTVCLYGPLKPFRATADELVALTAKDKKNRSGSRSFVLPVGIGGATVVRDVTDDELLQAASAIAREAADLSAS